MAPTFSSTEYQAIRAKLLETGRELFTAQGLKKTSLDELTQPAGIAKSTFYRFFESKELLYLELLSMEGPGLQQRVVQPFLEAAVARQGIEHFLRTFLVELETNPLTRRLLTHPEELQMVARRVSPAMMEYKIQHGIMPLVSTLERWQQSGQVIQGDPNVLGGVVRAVTLLTLHRKDIGEELFPDVLDLMIRLIAQGLSRDVQHSDKPDDSEPCH